MKRPVLAFLSLVSLSHVVGCADESARGPALTFDACKPLEIGVEPSLTAEQLQGVTDGLAMWNQAAGTALELVSDPTASAAPAPPAEATPDPDSSPDMTVAAPNTQLIPLVFQVAAGAFHGFYDNQAGMVFINEDLTAVDPLRITIAHEIGHAFGLPHVSPDVRASLMNSGNTTIGVTPDDVAALAAIWGRCSPP